MSWMAWTWPTAFVFIGIFTAMITLTVLEIRNPGGDERLGALRLVTTRGDRLFIALLGTSYIFLAWLAAKISGYYHASFRINSNHAPKEEKRNADRGRA
jgi:predicted small integral membrane protein